MSDLANWERSYFEQYEQDEDVSPFLVYAVFGNFKEYDSVSKSKYRCSGIPSSIDLTHHDKNKNNEVWDRALEGYAWDSLKKKNPKLSKLVQESNECITIQGSPSDFENLNYLRDIVGYITYLFDQGGLVVADPQVLHFWDKSEWKEKLFTPNGSVPRHHIVIHTTKEEDGDLSWFRTRGMRKFGKPDISVHNVSSEFEEGVIDLLNRFIEFLAFGGIIEEGQEVKMNSLPEGLSCHHKGSLDDPDFSNFYVEIE